MKKRNMKVHFTRYKIYGINVPFKKVFPLLTIFVFFLNIAIKNVTHWIIAPRKTAACDSCPKIIQT